MCTTHLHALVAKHILQVVAASTSGNLCINHDNGSQTSTPFAVHLSAWELGAMMFVTGAALA